MANSETIKTTIDANINTNGNQAITGAVMNSVLKQMVDATDAELAELGIALSDSSNIIPLYRGGIGSDGNPTGADLSIRCYTQEFLSAPFYIKVKEGFRPYYLSRYKNNNGQYEYIDRLNLPNATEADITETDYVYRITFAKYNTFDIISDDELSSFIEIFEGKATRDMRLKMDVIYSEIERRSEDVFEKPIMNALTFPNIKRGTISNVTGEYIEQNPLTRLAVTGYMKTPFRITIPAPLSIYYCFEYLQMDNGDYVYKKHNTVNSNTLEIFNGGNIVYRLLLRKNDNSDISDSEIESLKNSLQYDGFIDIIHEEDFLKERTLGLWNYEEKFHVGNIAITSGGWTYSESGRRVCTREGVTIPLEVGDVISLLDWTNNKMYVGWKKLDGTYDTPYKWVTNDYVVTERGYYVLNFEKADFSQMTLEYIVNNLRINNGSLGAFVQTINNKVDVFPIDLYNKGNLSYYGEKLSLAMDQIYKCSRNKIYGEVWGNGNFHNYAQSMAIYNNKVFVFLDNNYTPNGEGVVIYDMTDFSVIATTTLPEVSHNNNAQFTDVFFDDSDTYPLLMVSRGDYPNGNSDFYIMRIIENDGTFSFEVVKTIHCSMPQAKYNGSWVANFNQKRLWLYTMTLGDWRVTEEEGNRLCLFEFALPDITTPEEITLTSNDVVRFSKFDYAVLQGATEHGGLLFLPVGQIDNINGTPISLQKEYNIIVVNPDNGRVVNVIEGGDYEDEGIAVYNGKLYVNSKRGGTSFDADKEVFQIIEYQF